MPFHLQFKDCLFALQIPICSNVLYTALSPTGEHQQEKNSIFHTARYFQEPQTDTCLVEGTGAEANGRQGGVRPPFFSGSFLSLRSKLTSSVGTTGRVCILV